MIKLVVFASLLYVSKGAVTVCPEVGSISEGLKYHADATCDRASYNSFKGSLNRHIKYNQFKALGDGVSSVANQKTVKCPAAGAVVNMHEEHQPAIGMDTVFFLENTASTPVVVSYLDIHTGIEVSAKNPKISPAIADPTAILQPGSWMAVYAFEGHQFVVREVLKTGVAGNVLLQHRAGLIPVGVHADHLECPLEDNEPIVNNTRAPAFQRTEPANFRPCNTMDIGFRNVAPCPLHGYYVSGEGESCQEDFKFHLGVEKVTPDFMWDWKSPTKYEGTFIGHTFHFRSAANPAILVDTITLQPIVVTDCPTSKNAVAISVQGEAETAEIGRLDLAYEQPGNNVTSSYSGTSNATASDYYQHHYGVNASTTPLPALHGHKGYHHTI